ncbi:MAG TPA: hypothetical protein VGE07_31475 [Herpetosiphonaceae bacterium]
MSYEVPRAEPFAPCPRCGNPDVRRVAFTWWGGMVGPRLLKLAACPLCGLRYRGDTGGSPRAGMLIYLGVSALLALAALAALALL